MRISVRCRLVISLIFCFLIYRGSLASAQVTRIADGCDVSVLGERDKQGIVQFDSELRQALTSHDAAAMSLLVEFPLRVNGEKGTYFLQDAPSLRARFDEIFTARIRKVILEQPIEQVFCNYTGIAYGNGDLWASVSKDSGYRIVTINLGDSSARLEEVPGSIIFACQTKKNRVIVDRTKDGSLRYRSWNIPRSIFEKPDLEMHNGKNSIQGTGPCAYESWSFAYGKIKFEVSQLGCTENTPPKGSRGTLSVTGVPNMTSQRWCF